MLECWKDMKLIHSVAGSRHEDDEEPVYEVMSYLGGARPSLRHKQKVTETTELW